MEEMKESVSAPVAETVTENEAASEIAETADDALPADFFDEADGAFSEEEGMTSEAEEAIADTADTEKDAYADNTAEESDTDFATRAERDIAVLRQHFPEMEGRTLADLPSPRRYGELRELGLSPEEAYLATLPRSRVRDGGGKHLSATAPRRVVGRAVSMSHAEMRAASELFPEMSGRDILSLYKRVQA